MVVKEGPPGRIRLRDGTLYTPQEAVRALRVGDDEGPLIATCARNWEGDVRLGRPGDFECADCGRVLARRVE